MTSSGQPLILIHESSNSLIYHQPAGQYDTPVIIKVLNTDHPTPHQLVRLNNEYEFTKDLPVDGVRKAIAQTRIENRPALVMEYVAGQTLEQAFVEQRQSLHIFLQVGIHVSRTLGEVHQHHIIHRDINSHNILVDLETRQASIIDFSLASRLDLQVQHLGNPEGLAGTLTYMSPEQTGRMNRAVDYRTDLYSLGVTFYEMLTGRLPFESDDPLALVHAHMAKAPQPAMVLNPEIPPLVSDIVMKLLAKNAEDRYQSAFGLQADLERCLAYLEDPQGSADLAGLDFELGQDDYPGQLYLPQKLYGRAAEIATLLAAFDRVAAGSQELTLVAGYAGVGKSALVAEVHKPITEKRGYFIGGKFGQYLQNTPYAAFTQAFNQFAELLLTERETTLQMWRERILAALDGNGAVLTEVMPTLERVIGPQPAVPKLGGQENRNRFNLTFRNFAQAISTAEHPLVVFIDDWQWADLSSLELLKVLLIGERITHLLLIGAYRDNEVDRTHPLMMTLSDLTAAEAAVQTIELGNLQLEDVRQLIQESLACSMADSQALAELVYAKTQGNAFFTRQFLQNLYKEGWLHFDFDTRRWTWDIAQITAQNITDNVVDLMAGRIKKLAPETAGLLQLAACIGNEFDLQTLALISQMSEPTALAALAEALTQSLVIPLDDYYKLPDAAARAHFSFLHDRVQQAAYAQIPASARQDVHLEIGRLLLANTPAAELEQRVFDIVQHYNQATPLIAHEAERLRVAELNRHAADLAYGAAAFGPAQTYLETAMSLMPPDAWSNRYDVMLNLHSLLATVLSLTGDTEQLERIYQIVEKQAHTMIDTAQVKKAKIQSLLYHGNYTDAIELGLTFIQGMGIPVNRNPSPEEAFKYVQETDDWLTQDRIESLSRLPEASVDVGHILEVATTINGPLYNSEMPLFLVFVSQIMRLCIEQGLTPWSPVTIINFAMALAAIMHNIPKAQFITNTTMKLLEEWYDADILASPLNLLIGGFILHRYDHLRNTLPVFVAGVQKGLTTGTFQYASYCAWWQVWHLLFSGEPLPQVEAISQQAEETCEKTQLGRMKDWCLLIHQVTLNLQGKSEAPCTLTGSVYDEQEKQAYSHQVHDSADVFRFFLYKAWLHYLFQDPRASVKLFREAESYMLYGTGTYFVPLFYFYDTLANAAFFDLCTPEEHPGILERIQHNLKEFEVWVRFAPMNHQHKQDLMNAEKARIEGRDWEALTFYEKAIQGARDNGFLHEEALACERAAEFYLSRGLEESARLCMTQAYDGYGRWQAWAKVQDLEQRYPRWLAKPAPISAKESAVAQEERLHGLDLKSVMKASQAISGQIVLDELLKTLMEIVIENAGAQRGCLILEKDGQWVIEAAGTADPKDVTTLQAIKVEESDAVCPSIIRYIARSHESIVLEDAAQKGLFVSDPYVKRNQTKSVLCTPLLNRGRLSGILYLENNLAANTFIPERINVLELLAGQAAIALENARLYQQAQQEIAERKLVEVALRESEQRFRTIFNSVNDAIFVHDPATGDILDVNAKMCTMYGYTREEALQITVKDLSSGKPPYTQRDALAWMKKASTGEPQLFEWMARDKDGRLFWVEVNMRQAVLDQDRLLVVVRDITERKRAEETLRESEERLRVALEGTADGIWDWNPETGQAYFSPRYYTMLGYEPGEFSPAYESWRQLLHPDDAEAAEKVARRALEEHTPFATEFRLKAKDGDWRWILSRGKVAELDREGNAVRMAGSHTDITERKQTEEALHESEERFRQVLESLQDAAYRRNLQTDTYDYMSPAQLHISGYTAEEILSAPAAWVVDRIHPDDLDHVVCALEESMADGQGSCHMEYRFKCKDGQYRWMSDLSTVVWDAQGRPLYRIGTVRDITERKRTEAVLQESEARWRSLVNSAPAVIMTVDEDGQILTTNRTISGKDAAQVVGTSLYDYLPSEDHGRVREAVEAVFRTGASQHYEIRGSVPSGDEFWFETYLAAIRPADEVEAAILISIDTTERKRVEIELAAKHEAERKFSDRLTILATITNELSKVRALDELYRHAVEAGREQLGFDRVALWFVTQDRTTMVGTYGTDADGQTTDERFSQHPISATSGLQAIVDGSDVLKVYKNASLYQDGKRVGVGERLAIGLWDGETVMGFLSVDNLIHQQPFTDQDCELLRLYALALGHLFSLKHAQDELAQLAETLEQRVAERTAQMEAANKELEAFSYSVSHDLRAPLRIVDGYTRILEKDYAPLLDAEGERVCAVIHHQTQLMGELIDDLLALSRLSRTEMHMVPINMETLARLVFDELAATEAQERLDFHVDPLPPAVGDPTMIRQVWTNLLSNAIKFSANRERAVIRVSGRQEARETVYSVRDNGAGFEMEYADKLFGVFQRLHSRREFEGTGVGLAIVQRVIHRHGGRVWAESEVDQGATFYFALRQKGG